MDHEEESDHEVFSRNKFCIEDDTQFLELAKKLDVYIKSKPTLLSPRKKQLDSQSKDHKRHRLNIKNLVRQMTMGALTTEFSEEELQKVLKIYEQKPFHDRKRLIPDALEFMKGLARRIPFFYPFSKEVVEGLLHGGTAIKLNEGAIVYSEEDIVGYMFIVLKGRVEIFKKDIDNIVNNHRFEIGDSSATKVMPLLIGENSSLFANASANYVGLLNFGSNSGFITKYLVNYVDGSKSEKLAQGSVLVKANSSR